MWSPMCKFIINIIKHQADWVDMYNGRQSNAITIWSYYQSNVCLFSNDVTVSKSKLV